MKQRADIRDRFSGLECLLDGKPANILGASNHFATIAHWPEGLRVEFSWETVERIMKRGGQFRSGVSK